MTYSNTTHEIAPYANLIQNPSSDPPFSGTQALGGKHRAACSHQLLPQTPGLHALAQLPCHLPAPLPKAASILSWFTATQ